MAYTPREQRHKDTAYSNEPVRFRNAEDPILKKPRTTSKSGRSHLPGFLGICFLLILACVGGYMGYFYRSSKALRTYGPIVISNVDVATEFPNTSAINLMIIGRDYDYNNRDEIIRTHARSDMLMVAHLDFVAKTARVLSIPRDTAADIPGHGFTKINAAHAYGGPSLAGATIERNFGIKPDHYMALDFDGFKQAIDELGGVDCVVDKKMDYDDNWGHLHIHLTPGLQHLDGDQAMGFVRFRHSDSDIVRTQRQQELLAVLKQRLVQPQTLVILPQLLDTINNHVDTDLTDNQKVALAKFLHGLPQGSVQMATLPSIEGGELVQTDWQKSAPLIRSIFGVDPPQQAELQPIRRHRFHMARDRRSRYDKPLNVT